MKNIIIFITHKTLSLQHAQICFQSIANQEIYSKKKFDFFYIYNTHEDEITNEQLINLFYSLRLDRKFKNIKLFEKQQLTSSLGEDVNLIRSYFIENYEKEDRVLLLKSDCVLSKNYFEEILNLQEEKYIYFVAPFICAKSRISDEEILEYSKRDKFIRSDEITFFVEDQKRTQNNDFYNRPDISIFDEQIKFTSCYVIIDFSCHFLSIGLMKDINVQVQSWGGCNFSNLIDFFIETDKCFVIHKYHGIISDNRLTDREGPVVSWLNS